MSITVTVTTHIREKQISSTKSQTANKDIVSVICWPRFFILLLIWADFIVRVYYLNHPQHWFLGKGRRTWWSGESCQRAVSSEARKPTLNTGERRLYLVRAKCWIPGSNLSGLQPSQQDRPLSGAGREGAALGANPAKSNTLGEKVLKGPGVCLLISKTNFFIQSSHGKRVYRHIDVTNGFSDQETLILWAVSNYLF